MAAGVGAPPSLRAKRSNLHRFNGSSLDCLVAEPVIGPRFARTRWLLAMTSRGKPRHPRGMPERCMDIGPRSERAQGTPDAGRTREPCVQKKVHFAHASNNRAAETTGVPCAMVHGLWRALPGVRALIVTVACRHEGRKLDLGIGRPGPHAFARPRRSRSSSATVRVHRMPASNVRDGRDAPLQRRRDGSHIGTISENRKQNIFAPRAGQGKSD